MVEVIVVDSDTQQKPRRRLRWLWILLTIILVLAIAVGAFTIWASMPVGELMPEAEAALLSDERVTVTGRGWLAFIPHDAPPTAGIILYPGGRVQAEAYAPLARRIAEEGYLATIVYAPINLAILNPNAAGGVMENFSAIDTWVVGGHSLGGSTAGIFAANHPDSVSGVVFIASYPANDALVNLDIPILSIYGTNDGVAETEDIVEAVLPSTTRFVPIEGGNHSQFGYYRFQSGDSEATISRDEQIDQTIDAIIAFLDDV